MKRKDYQKPMILVVQLQHTGMLMACDPQVGLQKYNVVDCDEE